MIVEKCVYVECPNCEVNTPVPMLLRDYEWKNEKYAIANHVWHCVHCGDQFTVQVVRGITKVEVVDA